MELNFRPVKRMSADATQAGIRWKTVTEAVERLKPGFALEVDVPEIRMKTDFRGALYGALRNKGLRIRSSYSSDRKKIYIWFDGYISGPPNIPDRP